MRELPATIGRYQVERLLGEGGMGVLYLAKDPVLERHVGLKLLRVDSVDLRRRFVREAQSAARIQHPNIVTVYDVGDHEGQLYIAMEYIDGDTLASLIRDNVPFSPIRKLDIIDEIADGLGFAHQRGIIHRDIKPANLMITRSGLVKVLDFGIARVAHKQSGAIDGPTMIGTPAYMAPEQLEGAEADARSDIYAVGLVMYELFSGRRAFVGATTADVLQMVLEARPTPIERLVPEIDPDLARVVGKAMSRLPEDRYADLQAMRKDLARARRRAMQASADDATIVVGMPAAAVFTRPAAASGAPTPAAPTRDLEPTPVPAARDASPDGSGQPVAPAGAPVASPPVSPPPAPPFWSAGSGGTATPQPLLPGAATDGAALATGLPPPPAELDPDATIYAPVAAAPVPSPGTPDAPAAPAPPPLPVAGSPPATASSFPAVAPALGGPASRQPRVAHDSGPLPLPLPSVPASVETVVQRAAAGRATVDVGPALEAITGKAAVPVPMPAASSPERRSSPPRSAVVPPAAPLAAAPPPSPAPTPPAGRTPPSAPLATGTGPDAGAVGSGTPLPSATRKGLPAAAIVGGLLVLLLLFFALAFFVVRLLVGAAGDSPLWAIFSRESAPQVTSTEPAAGADAAAAGEPPPAAAPVPPASSPSAVDPAAGVPSANALAVAPPEAPNTTKAPAAQSVPAAGAVPRAPVPPTAVARPTPPVGSAAPRASESSLRPTARQNRTQPLAPVPNPAPVAETPAPSPTPRETTPAAGEEAPAVREAPVREPERPAAPRDEALGLVRAYVAARNTSHAAGIRRVWPGVDETHLRRITSAFSSPLTLGGCTVEASSADRAVATCTLTQAGTTGVYASNQNLTIRRTFMFDLAAQGRTWVIVGLRE